jgi:acyl-homoserine lactone acylase PvdQ
LKAILILSIFYIFYLSQKAQLKGDIFISSEEYGEIKIKRDEEGIPHIRSEKSFNSICFAQGFLHA